jgi:hypothetical protein
MFSSTHVVRHERKTDTHPSSSKSAVVNPLANKLQNVYASSNTPQLFHCESAKIDLTCFDHTIDISELQGTLSCSTNLTTTQLYSGNNGAKVGGGRSMSRNNVSESQHVRLVAKLGQSLRRGEEPIADDERKFNELLASPETKGGCCSYVIPTWTI